MHRFRSWTLDPSEWRTQRNRLLPIEGGDGSTLSLDFTTGVLDPRLTFTRGTNATFINSSGYVEWAGQNVLLQTANMTLWTTSTNIDTSAWGSKADPFGGTTAVRITPTGTVTPAQHYLGSASVSSVTLGNGLRTVYSVYAKAATSRYPIFGMVVDNGNAQASFVLTGAGEGTATTHLGTNVSAYMTSVGNGWYRCVMTWPTSAMSASCWCAVLANNTTVPSGQTFTAQADDVSGGHGIFVYGAQWEQGATPHSFIPTTSSAKSDIPRFDYDPDPTRIGTPRGLLIEGSANNIATYSESFNPSGWNAAGLNGSAVTSTSQTNPANVASSIRLVEDTATSSHAVFSVISAVSGSQYTFSVFVRGDGTRTLAGLRITLSGAATDYSVIFDLADGTNGTAYTNGSPGTATPRAVQYPGGWWRISVTINAPAASTLFYIYNATSKNATAGVQAYAGTGSNGIYVWGAQVELGSGASSYIPTWISTGNRDADSCVMSGTNFSSWFVTTGTFLVEHLLTNAFSGIVQRVQVGLGKYSSGNGSWSYFVTSSTLPGTAIWGSGGTGYQEGTSAVSSRVPIRSGMTIDWSGASRSNVRFANGTVGGTTTTTGTISVDQMIVGANGTSTTANRDFQNGHIRSIKFWPYVLPNSQIQSLTT